MLPLIGYIIVTYVAWRIFSKIFEAKDGEQTWLGAFAIIAVAYFTICLALTEDKAKVDLKKLDAVTSSIQQP